MTVDALLANLRHVSTN